MVSLGCVVLVRTGEFFQPEDDMLQRLDVRDLVQRRDLQLVEQPLHRVRVEPLGNGVKRSMPRVADSSICKTFRLVAASRISLG